MDITCKGQGCPVLVIDTRKSGAGAWFVRPTVTTIRGLASLHSKLGLPRLSAQPTDSQWGIHPTLQWCQSARTRRTWRPAAAAATCAAGTTAVVWAAFRPRTPPSFVSVEGESRLVRHRARGLALCPVSTQEGRRPFIAMLARTRIAERTALPPRLPPRAAPLR
jgi:hypothetical protein